MPLINLRTSKNYDIKIDRSTIWGNPFQMKKEEDRELVIIKHKLYLNTRPDLLQKLHTLNGKILACWCSPKPCHGDTLLELSKSKWVRNWFSNMLPLEYPFIEDGISYHTSENYYQAQKVDVKLRHKLASVSPFAAKKMIRDRTNFPWREDWNSDLSLEVMSKILKYKFSSPKWSYLLGLTEDWEIVEWNNWGDRFWGVDLNTKLGENHLGKIIMKIREDNETSN